MHYIAAIARLWQTECLFFFFFSYPRFLFFAFICSFFRSDVFDLHLIQLAVYCTFCLFVACLRLILCVYTIILIWWSQIIKSPSFTLNSVNQWLFFPIRLHFYSFFLVCIVCMLRIYVDFLCVFFLLFNFFRDGTNFFCKFPKRFNFSIENYWKFCLIFQKSHPDSDLCSVNGISFQVYLSIYAKFCVIFFFSWSIWKLNTEIDNFSHLSVFSF